MTLTLCHWKEVGDSRVRANLLIPSERLLLVMDQIILSKQYLLMCSAYKVSGGIFFVCLCYCCWFCSYIYILYS